MLKLLPKIFRREIPQLPFDIGETCESCVLTLPRCSVVVLAVSCRYPNSQQYEMLVNTACLMAWAKNFRNGIGTTSADELNIALMLEMWLRGADVEDCSITYLPEIFIPLLSNNHQSFQNMVGTEIFCSGSC